MATFALVSSRAQAQNTTTPAERFARCYSQLTRLHLLPNHPLLKAVVSGQKTPEAACIEVLHSAQTDPVSGELVNKTNVESRAVLHSFFDFFRSWFPAQDFRVGIEMAQARQEIHVLHDPYEASLHVLNALVNPQGDYTKVMTGKQGFEALRSSGSFRLQDKVPPALAAAPDCGNYTSTAQIVEFDLTGPKYNVVNGNCVPAKDSNGNPVMIGKIRPFEPKWIQTGELYGVHAISGADAAMTIRAEPMTLYGTSITNADLYRAGADQVPLYTSMAGAVGTHSYLVLNFGKTQRVTMDGAMNLPRRWVQATYKAFLCRDLPLLRPEDVQAQLTAYTTGANAAKQPPFRSGLTCMQCHAGMDAAAASLRNIWLRDVAGNENDTVVASVLPTDHPTTSDAILPAIDEDRGFSRRPPNGRLYYRDYQGKLVDVPVTGIAGLAAAMADQDEYSICAASRLFEYFTGIHTTYTDPTLLGAEDSLASKYKPFVTKLGLELKTHHSLMKTVESILSSQEYQEAR